MTPQIKSKSLPPQTWSPQGGQQTSMLGFRGYNGGSGKAFHSWLMAWDAAWQNPRNGSPASSWWGTWPLPLWAWEQNKPKGIIYEPWALLVFVFLVCNLLGVYHSTLPSVSVDRNSLILTHKAQRKAHEGKNHSIPVDIYHLKYRKRYPHLGLFIFHTLIIPFCFLKVNLWFNQ